MSKNLTLALLFGGAAVILATFTYYNYTLPPLGVPGEQTVAASIFPIYDIARNVAGDAVEVKLLLPPGASPHTFEPTPTTLKELRDTAALYTTGHGADDWVVDLLAGSKTAVVVVDDEIELRKFHEREEEEEGHGHGHEHEDEHHHHGNVDPHYWLSIPNAKHIAANIADDMAERFPQSTETIRTNLHAYLEKLDTADAQIRIALQNIENNQMVTLHDAWYYFAEEYGLEITATFEPTPGREPTPQYLAALGHAVDESGVSTIYSEPQLATDTLEPFVEDHNLTIAILDPLGGLDGRDNYIATMIHNAETVAQNQ